MLPVISSYSLHEPMTGGVLGCDGTCAAVIRAPALLPTHCDSSITWQNFSAPWSPEDLKEYDKCSTVSYDRSIFGTYLTSMKGSQETLNFLTRLTGDDVANTCAGHINTTQCYLRSAVADYDVTITNNVLTLDDPGNPRLVHWANNTAITNETIAQFGLRMSEKPKSHSNDSFRYC